MYRRYVSKTHKEGKRSGRNIKSPPSYKEGGKLTWTLFGRHGYGRTEKILRRNRKTWTRLLNKRRRRLDRDSIDASAKMEP